MFLINGEGFRNFVHQLDPPYKLPDHTTITKTLLPQLLEEQVKKLTREVTETQWIAKTTDMWMSLTGKLSNVNVISLVCCHNRGFHWFAESAFMAVTAHFITGNKLFAHLLDCSQLMGRKTGENIASRLTEVLDMYKIKDKITCCVADGAANEICAITGSGVKHVHCFAHVLNLCMSDALKQSSDLNRLKKRVSEFMTAVRQSSTLREEFQACQQHLGSKKKVLIKDVETRWNSTYLMIERFADLKESVVLFQLSKEGSTFKFTEEDFTLAEQVVHLLEPMYSATVELSGEKYISGSKVIPMTKILMRF